MKAHEKSKDSTVDNGNGPKESSDPSIPFIAVEENRKIKQPKENKDLDAINPILQKNLIKQIGRRYYRLCTMAAEDVDLREKFTNSKYTGAFLTDGKYDGKYVWTKEENKGRIRILGEPNEPNELYDGDQWPGVGMKIPKETTIMLDHSTMWPTLVITKKEDEKQYVRIKELSNLVRVFKCLEEGTIEYSNQFFEQFGIVDIDIKLDIDSSDRGKYEGWNFALHMPNFIPDTDALTKIHINKKDIGGMGDIVLTTC